MKFLGRWTLLFLAIPILFGLVVGSTGEATAQSTGGLFAVASAGGATVYRMTRDGVTCFVVTRGDNHYHSEVGISCVK